MAEDQDNVQGWGLLLELRDVVKQHHDVGNGIHEDLLARTDEFIGCHGPPEDEQQSELIYEHEAPEKAEKIGEHEKAE